NVIQGNYPIWNILRVMFDFSDPAHSLVPAMVANEEIVASTQQSDFVPLTAMQVFRSHYTQVVGYSDVAQTIIAGAGCNNGYLPGIFDTGGDVGGAILTINSELDAVNDGVVLHGGVPQQYQQCNLFQ